MSSKNNNNSVAALPPTDSWLSRRRERFLEVSPGLLVAVVVAAGATFLSEHYGAPVMLMALLLGMALGFLHEEGRAVAGIKFTSSTILRIGVALLGMRITVEQIFSLGGTLMMVVIGAVLLFMILFYRLPVARAALRLGMRQRDYAHWHVGIVRMLRP